MSIEKTPVYTVPKFLKEYIKERNIESPDPLEEYRESMELDNYFQKCDNEEIYINFPQKDKAYELFSKALKKIKSITPNEMDYEIVKGELITLYADFEYYSRLDKICDKAKFLITDPFDYEELKYDITANWRLVIYDEDKELLKTLVKTIRDKIKELTIYLDDFRNFM